jgi:hypothetical protein
MDGLLAKGEQRKREREKAGARVLNIEGGYGRGKENQGKIRFRRSPGVLCRRAVCI